MSSINFQKTYLLGEAYENIKEHANEVLDKYLEDPDLIKFNDVDKSVTFTTERLIPAASTNRPRVMLLFSNPHPNSIQQGMFLSPNRKGRENLFWPIMRDAGWITFSAEKPNSTQLLEGCLEAKYQGPFELIFYCYYAFPTNYPEDIIKIFGKEYFEQVIEPDAMDKFRKMIQKTSAQAVVVFNKRIFNLVSKDRIELYIEGLEEGRFIQSQIDGIGRDVPVFLTFPTGWRYHRQYQQYRRSSLDSIKATICGKPNEINSENTKA